MESIMVYFVAQLISSTKNVPMSFYKVTKWSFLSHQQITLPKTNSKRTWKFQGRAPKGMFIWTNHPFSGANWLLDLLVSGSVKYDYTPVN